MWTPRFGPLVVTTGVATTKQHHLGEEFVRKFENGMRLHQPLGDAGTQKRNAAREGVG